jgi:integrase
MLKSLRQMGYTIHEGKASYQGGATLLSKKILGHSSYAITADIYTDVLPSMQKEAMDKWDDVFISDEQDDEQVQ